MVNSPKAAPPDIIKRMFGFDVNIKDTEKFCGFISIGPLGKSKSKSPSLISGPLPNPTFVLILNGSLSGLLARASCKVSNLIL